MVRVTAVHDDSTNQTESELILAARKGDAGAFNQLVLGYQDRIYNLAARILGDSDTAEDITQTTFLTAYINFPRFRNGCFRSWLYRIATNACYDVYRQRKRYPVMSIGNKNLAEERLSPLSDFSCSSSLPEAEVERRELEQLILHALEKLDPDQRTIIILVDQQEFDYQETAQILGIPIGTVKSRLARARMRLQQLLNHSITTNRPLDG